MVVIILFKYKPHQNAAGCIFTTHIIPIRERICDAFAYTCFFIENISN